jgi:hypothetical protein
MIYTVRTCMQTNALAVENEMIIYGIQMYILLVYKRFYITEGSIKEGSVAE